MGCLFSKNNIETIDVSPTTSRATTPDKLPVDYKETSFNLCGGRDKGWNEDGLKPT